MNLSHTALEVLNRRYLKDGETPEEMFERVAYAVAKAEANSDVDYWAEKFQQIMLTGDFLPNSPTLINAGKELGQLSACFVLPIEDNTPSIFDAIKYTAMIHKSGGGTGFSFSRLRPKNDIVRVTRGVSCLTKDTVLYNLRSHNSAIRQQVTIEQLYKIRQRNRIYPRKIKCMVDNGILGTNAITDIIYNGRAIVYEIITKVGYRIKATQNHRFLVKNFKWQMLKDFKIGDKIGVNGNLFLDTKICIRCGRNKKLRSEKSKYKGLCESCVVSIFNKCTLIGTNEHKKVLKKRGKEHSNWLQQPEIKIKRRLQNLGSLNPAWKGDYANEVTARQRIRRWYPNLDLSICHVCFSTERIEIHHKDFNPYNNSFNNLEILCCKCHNKKHQKIDSFGDPRLMQEIFFDEIISINEYGIDDVYDVAMNAPYHNFIANGFVSHNSGPVSFMTVFNAATEVIKQGGVRRGANMAVLHCSHPDILEFVTCKHNSNSHNNFNLSVGATNKFMYAVEHNLKWDLVNPRSKEIVQQIAATELFDIIAKQAWEHGDPGILFLDEMNYYNPTPHLGEYECSNPCFTGNTEVETVFGPMKFKNMVGKNIPVLTRLNDGKFAWREMHNIRKTKNNAKLVRVFLDNNTHFDCTPEHEIYDINLHKIKAKDLLAGTRLSAFYKYKANQKGYIRITNGVDNPLLQHLVCQWKFGKKPDWPFEHCHHLNEIKTDNHPNNLSILSSKKHNGERMRGNKNPIHKITVEGKNPFQKGFKGKTNGRYRHDISTEKIKELIDSGLSHKQVAKQLGCSSYTTAHRLGWRRPTIQNHKVIGVVNLAKEQDVYCGTVNETHKFYLACGVLVKNCGEQPLLPWESCNLGSINLANFVTLYSDHFDLKRLTEVIQIAIRFLDNVITVNKFPLDKIKEASSLTRKVGLGVMGWADALAIMNVPYDSNAAFELGHEIMLHIQCEAKKASEELAIERGSYPANPPEARRTMRNATVTTIAPTGTLSIIAGCSSGIEPFFALAYKRNILDGDSFYEINPTVEAKFSRSEPWPEIRKYIIENGTLNGCKYVSGTEQGVFKTAHEIHYSDHIRMQAAFQGNVDNAVSKTINMSHEATVEDIKEAYLSAWRMKCKGITIYRDRSRDAQVLEVGHGDKKMVDISPTIEHATLTPQKRPNKLTGQTCKIETSCGTMYITINFNNDIPFEVFTMIGKAGGCASSQSEALGRLISLCLRAGIAPQHVVKQIRGITCHLPYGLGPKKVSSCPDAVAQALENILNLDKVENKTRPNGRGACPDCGSPLESGGGCATCTSCGYSDCG